MTVPRHRIPKIKAPCISCLSDHVTIVLSLAYAAGYMRRHVCKECKASFYTLADYERKGYKVQAQMFKDRALTPWEQKQRLDWQAEAVTREVKLEAPTGMATEFIETINNIFTKAQRGETLNDTDQMLYNAVNKLENLYDQNN